MSFGLDTILTLGTPALAASAGLAVILGAIIIGLSVALIRTSRKNAPFRKSFDTASVGLVHVAMDGRWLRVNDRMLEITGYERDELKSMSFADITVEEDLPRNKNLNTQLTRGEIGAYTLEKRYRRKDGRIVWVNLSVTLVRRRDGTPDYYVSVVEDIDDLKQAEFELQEQQARFRAFWDNSPFNQSLKDTHGRLVEVNKTYERTYGLPDDAVRGRSLSDVHDTQWSSDVDDFDREVLRTRTTRTADIAVPGKDGREITIRVTKFPVFDREGRAVGVGGISYDITSQIRAAQEIRESEERFRATFEQAAVGIAHVSIEGHWLRINQRYCDIVGYTEEELRDLTFRDITHSGDLTDELKMRDELIAGRIRSYTLEKRYTRKDGEPVWVEVTASLTRPLRDLAPYVIVVVEDITERKQAERTLADRLDQQSTVMAIGQLALGADDLGPLLNAASEMVAQTLDVEVCLISSVIDGPTNYRIVAGSKAGQKYIGTTVKLESPAEKRTRKLITSESMIFDNSDPDSPNLSSPIMTDNGTVSGASVVVTEGEKLFGALVAHARTHRHFTEDDITFLKSVANVLSAALLRNRIAEELVDRERTLNAVLDNAADGILVADAQGRIIISNDAAENVFGYGAEKLQTMRLRDLVPATYESNPAFAAHESQLQLSAREMIGLHADGTPVPIDIAMSEFEGPEGALHIALVRDISEQKSLQSQLIQASKLATVGEMAAGIAHELNQPLNIMRMAADNVLIRMDTGGADMDYVRENLSLISDQAGRMGKIILHMRVFSRQDKSDFIDFEPVRPVRNACELMRRQLQLESITLDSEFEEAELLVHGSESQLEQVIINLIANARDAILDNCPKPETDTPRGIVNVALRCDPADYIASIVVTDTGGGIPDDVRAKIFDPFFTTKDVGVGTGLGLSVSYGIVNSMSGTIRTQNTGEGCEMTIELPLAERSRDTATRRATAPR